MCILKVFFCFVVVSEEEVSASLAKEYDRPMLAAKSSGMAGGKWFSPGDRQDLRTMMRSSEHEYPPEV